jgi:hypothetical protein
MIKEDGNGFFERRMKAIGDFSTKNSIFEGG